MLEKTEDSDVIKYMVMYRDDAPPNSEGDYKWKFQMGFDSYVSALSYSTALDPSGYSVVMDEEGKTSLLLDKTVPPLERAAAFDGMADDLLRWPKTEQFKTMTMDEAIEMCRQCAIYLREEAAEEGQP